jgi:hypothetical protein
MTLDDFYDVYDALTDAARAQYLQKFFDYLLANQAQNEDYIKESLLAGACDYESDDYFGTEGFNL